MTHFTLSHFDLASANACYIDSRFEQLKRNLKDPHLSRNEKVPLKYWWDCNCTDLDDRWWSIRAIAPAPQALHAGQLALARSMTRCLEVTHPKGHIGLDQFIETIKADWNLESNRRMVQECAETLACEFPYPTDSHPLWAHLIDRCRWAMIDDSTVWPAHYFHFLPSTAFGSRHTRLAHALRIAANALWTVKAPRALSFTEPGHQVADLEELFDLEHK